MLPSLYHEKGLSLREVGKLAGKSGEGVRQVLNARRSTMTENLLVDIFGGRVQAFEGTVAPLRGLLPEDPLAEDVEEVVKTISADWPVAARQMWNWTLDRLIAGQISDTQAAGAALQGVLDGAVRVLGDFHRWVESLNRNGLSIGHVEDLGRAVGELRELRAYVVTHWPWLDKADIEEAEADYARGDYLPLDEAFAEIAGVDKETWLARAEERRRELAAQEEAGSS
jgi:hypothetical protein